MSEIRFDQQSQAGAGYNSSYDLQPTGLADDSAVDIMHYYRLMMRNLWKVMLFSAVLGGFSIFYSLSLTPIYFSKTTLLIESQQPNVIGFQDVYQVDTRSRTYLNTQLQILQSRAVAARVVDRLQLTKHPLFDTSGVKPGTNKFNIDYVLNLLNTQPKGEGDERLNSVGTSEINVDNQSQSSSDNITKDDLLEEVIITEEDIVASQEFENRTRKNVIEILMSSLVVYPMRGTKLVTIQFSAADAQLAADIANAFADVYIESHLEAKLEVTQKATTWLNDRLGDLRRDLRLSEQALQEYREREQLVDTGDIRSIEVAELEQLTESLVQATRAKNDANALTKQISKGRLPLDRLLSLPAISNNTVVQSLMESQIQAKRLVAELSKRYGEKHPKMLFAMSDVTQADEELRVQVNNISKGLEISYSAAQDSERALRQQIANVKNRLQKVSRKEFSLRELEREVEANRQVYEVFLNRGKETSETANLKSVYARVIDMALPADHPSKPEKKKIVMVAVLFSAMFAAGVVLLLDWLDNTIKTPEDVEERLRVPLLGHLPLDKKNKNDTPFLGFLDEENWHFSEAARTIRTSFILSGLDKPAKVTVVTSSVPNEGKSTVSLCIAHSLGQMEKVLLIDADMRRPSIGKALDISLLTPGLSNLIAGTANLEECITCLPKSEVHVITAGVVLGNPLDLIAGERFSKVLDMLKEKYDRIIIDSAPIQAVSDSIVIATHADALIYVVKSDSSSTPVIKRGLRRLSETNARFSGVVLNQVDIEKIKKQSGNESDYYDNYGYAYGDTNDSAS
ncbi:MAG: succinoglycan biosynthesis transport protein ExoP [Kiritimatiellia bacterium]|jgi:succinoglycan biosynthesis transport protein ExoP